MIELRLPYPPSVNHYWEHTAVIPKGKKTPRAIKYLSKRAKEFREEVQRLVHQQLDLPPRLDGRLQVTVFEHYGPREGKDHLHHQAQDIDNCLKPLFDALEWAKVYKNDEQIDQLLVMKKRRAAVGYVIVRIATIGE